MKCEQCGRVFPTDLPPPYRCACTGPRRERTTSRLPPPPASGRPADAGPKAWKSLHEMRDPAMLMHWLNHEVPSYGCSCKVDTRKYITENPPEEDFFRWGWKLHNWVNRKLGKPVMSYEDAVAMWRAE